MNNLKKLKYLRVCSNVIYKFVRVDLEYLDVTDNGGISNLILEYLNVEGNLKINNVKRVNKYISCGEN